MAHDAGDNTLIHRAADESPLYVPSLPFVNARRCSPANAEFGARSANYFADASH